MTYVCIKELNACVRACERPFSYLGLQSINELSILRENGEIEVVVVVGDKDFSVGIDADADGIVGDALPTHLAQELALVIENLDGENIRAKSYVRLCLQSVSRSLNSKEASQKLVPKIEEQHSLLASGELDPMFSPPRWQKPVCTQLFFINSYV